MIGNIWNKKSEQRVQQDRQELFERTVLLYLNSGYNLARWLTGNEQDAADVVQEASLRAWRSFDTFVTGRDGRAWFLAIVRNTWRTLHRKSNRTQAEMPLEEDAQAVDASPDPEAALIKKATSQAVLEALEKLPAEYREVIVLRELEELSYKDIAKIVEIPLGTVMSRLSRARRELHSCLYELSREAGR